MGRDEPINLVDEHTATIMQAWNLMGGEVNWGAVDAICEMLAYNDPERLVRGVCYVRDAKTDPKVVQKTLEQFEKERHAHTRN